MAPRVYMSGAGRGPPNPRLAARTCCGARSTQWSTAPPYWHACPTKKKAPEEGALGIESFWESFWPFSK